MDFQKLFGYLALAATMFLVSCNQGPPERDTVTGNFKLTEVSPFVGWVQAGVYDSKEGYEIAVLEYGKISFLNPNTFATKRTVPVDDDTIGYKTLVSLRKDGNLNLMRGGGGYSETAWYDLKGNRLWEFRMDKKLLPNKMLAEDLDGDGTKEFYVADGSGLFRLDVNGKVVWQAGTVNHDYLTVLPPEGKRPAAVVTENGMWDCRGKALPSAGMPSGDLDQLQFVKWGDSYRLASGKALRDGGNVFFFNQAGKKVFQKSIGNWGVGEILAVRFKAGEQPSLVVTGGRGGAINLMSLTIFAHDGTVLHHEIRKPASLLVIPGAVDGQDTLLLCGQSIRKLERL